MTGFFAVCFQIDLAISTGLLVLYYSSVLTARELYGPFMNESSVNVFMGFYQSLYFVFLSCVLSLQLVQVFSIFFDPNFNGWSENIVIGTYRVFAISVGFFIGISICSIGSGLCRPTPLNLYFLQETEEVVVFKQSKVTITAMAIFVLAIIICQVSIEVKQYLIDKTERKADKVSSFACRNINQAKDRLNGQTILEIGLENLPPPQVPIVLQEIPIQTTNPIPNSVPMTLQPNPCIIRSITLDADLEGEDNLSIIATDQVVRIARYICIFGILPVLLNITSLSLENINSLRPHAAMAFILTTYGVAVPFMLIISSKKMRQFSKTMNLTILKLE
jgi:hypothetical protein